MKKSDILPLPSSHKNYIEQIPDIDFLEALENSLLAIEQAPIDQWKTIGEKVYAPGKWTIKDLLQHIIDCERVFAYRVCAYARGEKRALLPFDEDIYAVNAQANERNIEALIEELILVRKSTIALFKSFNPAMLKSAGTAFDGSQIYVLHVAFIIAGHQKWHFNIIQERYLPLLEMNNVK